MERTGYFKNNTSFEKRKKNVDKNVSEDSFL